MCPQLHTRSGTTVAPSLRYFSTAACSLVGNTGREMREAPMTAKGNRAARAISGAGLAVVVIVLVGAFAAAGEARAGELAYKGCITGDSDHSTGPGACTEIPSS